MNITEITMQREQRVSLFSSPTNYAMDADSASLTSSTTADIEGAPDPQKFLEAFEKVKDLLTKDGVPTPEQLARLLNDQETAAMIYNNDVEKFIKDMEEKYGAFQVYQDKGVPVTEAWRRFLEESDTKRKTSNDILQKYTALNKKFMEFYASIPGLMTAVKDKDGKDIGFKVTFEGSTGLEERYKSLQREFSGEVLATGTEADMLKWADDLGLDRRNVKDNGDGTFNLEMDTSFLDNVGKVIMDMKNQQGSGHLNSLQHGMMMSQFEAEEQALSNTTSKIFQGATFIVEQNNLRYSQASTELANVLTMILDILKKM